MRPRNSGLAQARRRNAKKCQKIAAGVKKIAVSSHLQQKNHKKGGVRVIRGRKPKPTALKVLAGNPGKRQLNKNEPKPQPVAPKCPSWLNKEAKKEWRRIVALMEPLGLISGLDMANVASYCHSYAQMVEAEAYLAKHGLGYAIPQRDRDGVLTGMNAGEWPQVRTVRKCKEEIIRYSALFGLSVSDRSRLHVVTRERDEDDDFFAYKREPKK